MKKLSYIFAILLAGVFTISMSACSPDDTDSEELTLSTKTLGFIAAGGSKTVIVTGSGWTATPSADWIEITTADGQFTVTVGETGEAREGTITVGNASKTETIAVSQAAPDTDTTITVEPETLTFTAAGGEQSVTVTSELAWTASPSDSWIVVAEGDGSFTVTVAAYSGDEPREGSITIGNGVGTKTVAVVQEEDMGDRLTQSLGGYMTSALYPGVGIFTVYFASYEGNSELWPNDPSDNGHFMMLTFHTETPAKARNWNIPEGTYSLNPAGGLGTLRGNWYCTYDPVVNGVFGDGGGAMAEGTTVTVTGNGTDGYLIKMKIVMENGTEFKAYYDGAVSIPNNAIKSSFYDDVDVTVNTGLLQFYGTQNGQEGYRWRMYLYSDGVTIENGQIGGTGYCLQTQFTSLEILNGTTLPSAIYTIENSTAVNKALYGYSGGATGFAGMWLFELQDGVVENGAPIVSGSLTVMLSAGQYHIDMFGMDDADNDIKVRFVNSMTPVDMR